MWAKLGGRWAARLAWRECLTKEHRPHTVLRASASILVAATVYSATRPTYALSSDLVLPAAQRLKSAGYCLVDSAVSDVQVSILLSLLKSANHRAVEVTSGRLHQWLQTEYESQQRRAVENSTEEYTLVSVVDTLEQFFAPIVKDFFQDPSSGSAIRHRMTQLQLLNSLPGSEAQIFHADNISPGLTILIALDDITSTHGPTEMLVGTQHFSTSGSIQYGTIFQYLVRRYTQRWLGNDLASNQGENTTAVAIQVVHGTLKQKQALVFDSRILHRGMANRAMSNRPVLIMRYDPVKHQPPGVNTFETTFLDRVGQWVRGMHYEISTVESAPP